MADEIKTYAELVIGLYGGAGDSFQVELRFTNPQSDAEVSPARGEAPIDTGKLLALQLDTQAYGEALAEAVFHHEAVSKLYAQVKTAVETSGLNLRVRLLVAPSAPSLHGIRWELLTDPDTKRPLATSERILFSRFLTSQDWRSIKIRRRTELRVLIAVSAPDDIEEKGLGKVDLNGEIERARSGLADIPDDRIEIVGKDEPLTLDNLRAKLSAAEFDVLYLVCHGALTKKGPYLWLQNPEGKTDTQPAGNLAIRLSELDHPPRLVVLASCESARVEDDISALAPLLAEAGVPAILAMQGKISMESVKLAMPIFFSELMRDGQIDRAMAVARGAIREHTDSWMPALFLRLKTGRIWYVPGFGGGEEEEFEQWAPICKSVRRGECVPIIGPNFAEHVFGSTTELANGLAEKNGFPFNPNDRSDLARVTQYISTRHSPAHARSELQDVLGALMLKSAKRLTGDVDPNTQPVELLELIASAVHKDENDPFHILAGLDAKVYVSAATDPLLETLLREAGKSPEVLTNRWRDERRGERKEEIEKVEEESTFKGEPTKERPCLYYVFGDLTDEDTWVLTEDDFFDYLIQTSRYDLVPKLIGGSLLESSLLFLGFRLDDWKFRVLFRLIKAQGGHKKLQEHTHVAVQLDPDEHSLADAERAKKILNRYFEADNIAIYWGSTAEFLTDLRKRLDEIKRDEPAAVVAAGPKRWKR